MKKTSSLLLLFCFAVLSIAWQYPIGIPKSSSPPTTGFECYLKLNKPTGNKVSFPEPNKVTFSTVIYSICVANKGPITGDRCNFDVVASLRVHVDGNVWRDIRPTTEMPIHCKDECDVGIVNMRKIAITFNLPGSGRYEGDVSIWNPNVVIVGTPDHPLNIWKIPVKFDYPNQPVPPGDER